MKKKVYLGSRFQFFLVSYTSYKLLTPLDLSQDLQAGNHWAVCELEEQLINRFADVQLQDLKWTYLPMFKNILCKDLEANDCCQKTLYLLLNKPKFI